MSNFSFSKMEEEIADFWEKNNIFAKSVEKNPTKNSYVFYDGPPFATGLPHYGHIVGSVIKDMVPRYWTMRGLRVERRWGWDCHGLPVENLVEKEMGLQNKKAIEECGIDRFNESCMTSVLRYVGEWKKTIKRIGRFVDMENDYKTMDPQYMESIWWVFKQLWDKGLIYEGYKPMHICPRCATPLSNFEVTQGYKDVEDISVIAKFKLTEPLIKDQPTYVLAWTTTPWTLPANVLLAVNKNISYAVFTVEEKEGTYLAAEDQIKNLIGEKKFEIIKSLRGKDLVDLAYEPLFPYFTETAKAFRIVEADFVALNEGTGVVHIAPAFGENDMKIGEREEMPLVQPVGIDGRFVPEVTDFAGLEVKPKTDPLSTDKKVVEFLEKNHLVFVTQRYSHSYPHCWRCDSPLLNYVTASWFVKVTAIKDKMLSANKKMTWVPDNIKEGRFGKWLEEARDWAISRNRYWGTPIPVWRCQDKKCGHLQVVGSIKDLEKLTGQTVIDLHLHIIDKMPVKCDKCGGLAKRVPEVLDCWFESGSMPYAERHYPFENKDRMNRELPADFIAEGQDQTRGWFYTLAVLSAALFDKPPAKNVIVNGIVLAEDGQKMSKRLKNYPDPWEIFQNYGVDAMRYYLMSSPVVRAENLNFSEKGVKECLQKVVMILWNVFTFYQMYSTPDAEPIKKSDSKNILDRWIVARLHQLIRNTTEQIEKYELMYATRPLGEFINDLSTWYLRRSRDRFKSDNAEDKEQALKTLSYVLLTLSKVMAPTMPFISEKIYLEMKGGKESVHLEDWPEFQEKLIDKKLLLQMEKIRKAVELGLAARAEASIKVRQPLGQLLLNVEHADELKQIIAEELNVKKVKEIKNIEKLTEEKKWLIKTYNDITVALDTEISAELRAEGWIRELTRQINQLRKDSGLTIRDMVTLHISTADRQLLSALDLHAEILTKGTLAKELKLEKAEVDWQKETEIEGKAVWLGLKK